LLKAKPAAWARRPASISKKSQHQRSEDIEVASPRKSRELNYSPADPRPAPDDRGEDDRAFFARRPNVNSRKRLAFEGEPPAGVLERDEYDNVAFINVRLVRDPAGKPATILREIAYGQWGTA
jgi:hypothetical protein